MLRKVLIGVVAVVVVLIGAALIGPSFIDWNAYKDDFTAQVEQATGRSLFIDGDLSLQVLPSPALSAEGVRLANLPGGSVQDMVTVRKVAVSVELMPLLSGQVTVRSVEVIEPVIVAERLKDGTPNWEFTPAPSAVAGGPMPSESPAPTDSGTRETGGSETGSPPSGSENSRSSLDITLSEVVITDGTVIYRDEAAGVEERLEEISVTLAADTLSGPFEAEGALKARGLPLTMTAGVGNLAGQGSVPVDLTLGLEGMDTEATVNVLVTGLDGDPGLRGTVKFSSARPSAVAEAVAEAAGQEPTALPGPLAQPVSLAGQLVATRESMELNDLSISVAGTDATGALSVLLSSAVPKVDLTLAMQRIDLDSWTQAALEGQGAIRHASLNGGADDLFGLGSLVGSARAQEPVQQPAAAEPAAEKPTGFSLPRGLEVKADVAAEAATYNGSALRDLRFSGTLAGGEVTITQLSARLPGVSDVSVTGFVTDEGGVPNLDITLSANSNNLRAILDWLGVAGVGQVPAERLRTLAFEANVRGTPAEIQIPAIAMTLDTTNASGGATIRTGNRLGMGLRLQVDTLNVDAYLPPKAGAGGGGAASPSPSQDAGSSPETGGSEASSSGGTSPGAGGDALFAGLDALNGFDASFDLSVGSLTVNGLPINGLTARGSLVRGTLTLQSAGVDNAIADVKASASGKVAGFGGVPEFDGLTVSASVPNPPRLARAFQTEAPPIAAKLGAVDASITLSGKPDALTVDGVVQTAGATVTAKGPVNRALSGAPDVALALRVQHPNFAQLVRLASEGYSPKGGNLGAADIAAVVTGNAAKVALTEIDARVGESRIQGSASADLTGAKPMVAANLTSNALPIHAFLPAAQGASLERGSAVRKADLGVPDNAGLLWRTAMRNGGPAGGRGDGAWAVVPVAAPWTSAPIDLSGLQAANADITLKSDALIYDTLRINNADMAASLRDGTLTLSKFTGETFGGALDVRAEVASRGNQAYAADIKLAGLQVASMMAGGKGQGDLNFAFTAQGATSADIVRALNGGGNLALSGVDVSGDGAGDSPLGGLLALVGMLNQASSLGQAQGLADVTGTFNITNGVVTVDPIKMVSQFYNAAMAGKGDLVNWTVDAAGQAELAQSVISQLVGQAVKLPDRIPFTLKGNLDDPVIKMAMGNAPSLGGSVLDQVAPGATKELDKVAPGARQLLEGVLGGGSSKESPQQEEAPQEQSQDQPQEQQQKKNDDPVGNLLKGLPGLLGR